LSELDGTLSGAAARPPLALGHHGSIKVDRDDGRWVARFRDLDGDDGTTCRADGMPTRTRQVAGQVGNPRAASSSVVSGRLRGGSLLKSPAVACGASGKVRFVPSATAVTARRSRRMWTASRRRKRGGGCLLGAWADRDDRYIASARTPRQLR
jgi:hypothetical protein